MPRERDLANADTLKALALNAINEACAHYHAITDDEGREAHDALRDAIAEMSDDDLYQVFALAAAAKVEVSI